MYALYGSLEFLNNTTFHFIECSYLLKNLAILVMHVTLR